MPHNLWERLKKHEAAVLLFVRDPHMAFTNSRAAWNLRMAKVQQKVSGRFRAGRYAEAYCFFSGHGQSIRPIAFQMALSGEIGGE